MTVKAGELVSAEQFQKLQADFKAWLKSLSDLDRMNFMALINMKSARELIPRCPDKEYRKWATLAVDSLDAQKELAKNPDKFKDLLAGVDRAYKAIGDAGLRMEYAKASRTPRNE